MAYTYDDFIKAATDAGLAGSFEQSDLELAQKFPEFGLSLVSLKRDLNNAQTNEQRLLATEAANQLRKNYGSFGVGTGSEKTYASSFGSQINQTMDDIANYGPFEYSKAEDYQGLLDRLINREAFSFDPTTDPIYSSYKKAYNREGDRAAANALAAAAAATGGRASSYANVAAQQAGNYYAAKLADMIPELRSQALTEYNNDYSQLLSDISAMSGDRQSEFNVYQDRLNQLQQSLANLQAQDQTDYARYLDEINAEYQRERDRVNDEQTQFENALTLYQTTGQITGPLTNLLDSNSGAGSYNGSLSGNPVNDDQAQLDEITAKYKVYNIDGSNVMGITNWNDYQKIKELTGATDEQLNKLGVRYAYPTTTDANGNITPTKALGGVTWEEYDAAAGNYMPMLDFIQQQINSGATKNEVLADIKDAYNNGLLTRDAYLTMYNKYRNMDSSQFGTKKSTATTTTPAKKVAGGGAGNIVMTTR